MRRFLYLSVLIVFFSHCSESKKDDVVKVTFVIDKPIQDAGIVIEAIGPNDAKEVKKISMGAGNRIATEIQVKQPILYKATFFDRQATQFILSPTDTEVTINISGDDPINQTVNINGSAESARLDAVTQLLEMNSEEINQLNQRYRQATNQKERKALEDEFIATKNKQQLKVIALLDTMTASIVPLLASETINPDEHFDFFLRLSDRVKKELPASIYAKSFIASVETQKRLAVGSPAPEITLPTPDGETKSLSDFKGKFVLIDFWASWCKPCRIESPELVKLYNEYKEDGFEIFSVSLDRKKQDWVKAIRQDKLAWTHVSDLEYFNSKAAAAYEIQAIPATYLLNPEGVIIGKNLRGAALRNKIQSILNK